MFESLSDKLKRTLKNLRGEGVLTKEHVDAALREIRLALLEADVNYKVAKDFIAAVKEKAEGQQVWLELKPSEQVVKIVFDELVELLGGQSSQLVFTKSNPNVVMLVGLQGSGKTTSTGKIARWLSLNQQRKPLLLSTDVYSTDRQHLLIPAGSKLLGETKKVETFGQTRLAVAFHRILMPDGYSVSLDQFKGLNQIGDTGLRDQVNNHYLRIFGVSLAVGALGAVGQAGTGGALNATGGDLMRQGFAASTAQSASQILDKFLNIMPTVTIHEGHRVKVYLSGDLAVPDYSNHKMPSDL